MRLSFIILLWLCLGGAHASALPQWTSPEERSHPRVGQALNTATGEWITAQELADALAPAARVLIGEKHDNPDHQALQLWLLDALAQRRAQGGLVLEMLQPVQQPLVDALQGKDLPTGPVLRERLDWQPGWDWSVYGPLVLWGLTHAPQLLAANLDEEEIRTLYHHPVPLSERYDDEAQETLHGLIADSHCGKLPEAHYPAMVGIQQARDQRMAEVLQIAPAPAVLIAGAVHVRKDLGVPLHLDAGQPAPVVMLIEASAPLPGSDTADYLWLTPAMPARDYCADWN